MSLGAGGAGDDDALDERGRRAGPGHAAAVPVRGWIPPLGET